MILETLKKATNVAKQFNVDSFIVESNFIRGINEERTSAIFTNISLPLECSIGINRIDVLLSRMLLADDLDLIIEADGTNASNLIFKNDKLNVEYRTANSNRITAPKSLQVKDLYQIMIDKNLHKVLNKSKSALRADNLTIICNDNKISYQLNDDLDKLIYNDGEATHIEDSLEDINFIYNYSIKSLLNAFAKCDDKIIITEKGMIHFIVDDIDVYLLPKK